MNQKSARLLLVIVAMALAATFAYAQTSPAAYNLAGGDYSLTAWDATFNPAGTYPPSMRFHVMNTLDPTLTYNTTGDYVAAYNLSSATRIKGLGTSGFSFLGTSTKITGSVNDFLGAAVLSLNTSGRVNVVVNWTAGYVPLASASGYREFHLRLQYRVGTAGNFTDLLDNFGSPVEYNYNLYAGADPNNPYQTIAHNQTFTTPLPYTLENLPVVELRWKYYYVTGFGSRPEIRMDDISVTSGNTVGVPTKFQFTTITPGKPLRNIPFSIVVRTVDAGGTPKNVTANTQVNLQTYFGTGHLTGTLSQTLPIGQNTAVFSNLLYDQVESQVGLEVNGTTLALAQTMTSVLDNPTTLFGASMYSKGYVGINLNSFQMQATGANGVVAAYNGYPVTMTVVSGPGTIIGTNPRNTVAGIATFDDIQFTVPGNYTVSFSAPGLISYNYSYTIAATPTMTENIVPLFMKAAAASGSRVPTYALITINNLIPSTNYRFMLGARNVGFAWTTADQGAGIEIHCNYNTKTYTYNTNASDPAIAGNYSEFTTGAGQTSYQMWVNLIPSTNAVFTAQNQINWIFSLANENGSNITRFKSVNTTICKDFGAGATNITGIVDANSLIQPFHVIALYSDAVMPMSTGMVQSDGLLYQSAPGVNEAPIFYSNLDNKAGSWATIIPDSCPTGLLKIEDRNWDGTLNMSRTTATGIWNGLSTVNPVGGLTVLNFATPQLILDFPTKANNAYCNGKDGAQFITFRSNGLTAVDIQISSNGGGSWVNLATNYAANANASYRWNTPRMGAYSNTPYLIRVWNKDNYYTNPTLNDQSVQFTLYDSPDATKQSGPAVACVGNTVNFSLVGTGSQITYQWYKDGVALAGQTNPSLQLTAVATPNSGVYNCMVSGNAICTPTWSDNMPLYIALGTVITKQPATTIGNLGGTAAFSVSAHVNGAPPNYPIAVQWYKGAVALVNDTISPNSKISGANSSILTISNITAANFGTDYSAKITGLCGSTVATSNASLTQLTASFITDLTDVTTCSGIPLVSLTIKATTNTGTLAYQWYKDGAKVSDGSGITGSKTASLNIASPTAANVGSYYCIVTVVEYNYNLTSKTGKLIINSKPAITSQPTKAIAASTGKAFSIVVAASGSSITYQWSKDGGDISGATNATFTIASAASTDAGNYVCKISNMCGDVWSDTATVTVSYSNMMSVNDKSVDGFILSSSKPNPIDGQGTISFTVPYETNVKINLVDATGRKAAELFNGYANQGSTDLKISTDELNLTSGVYYYTMKAGSVVITQQMVVIK
ncbi:MAG: immunoglobulin domain-containing protein [Candidatus Kapabacteria bacterium]|nr:immunoglobulin domain-containing protein [Candidatus Kapabacteria bacterium]